MYWVSPYPAPHPFLLTKIPATAVDVNYNQIYCVACRDYVYDSDFDIVVSIEKTNALVAKHRLVSQHNSSTTTTTYGEWLPTRREAEILIKNSRRYIVPNHLLGVRGLQNLGNTCFMNSILQSFLHNPLVRNYFLSDMHNRQLCCSGKQEAQEGHNTKSEICNGETVCLGCEMDFLFSEIFNGIKTPYIPHHFLYSIWRHSSQTFAGYVQQDAHEFLIAALNGMHSHGSGTSDLDCTCLVHQIFNGMLHSNLTCGSCGHTSTTVDPFFDISVDIPKASNEEHQTLQNCLER